MATYFWFGFNPEAAWLLIREQGLHCPDRMQVVIDKNVNDICNVVRILDKKNANGNPDRGQQLSVIAQ